MDNIFVSIGSIDIYWYSILILIAIIIGYKLSLNESIKVGFKKEYINDLLLPIVLSSIIGARIYYVIFNLDYYSKNILDIFKIWEGGLAIYGAVIGGIISVIIYSYKHKESTFKTLDILMPSLILGQSIGRWGNFFNKEAYGSITSFEYLQKLHIPNFIIDGMYINGHYYHPTFFYESLWCFLGFIIILLIRKYLKHNKVSVITGIYLVFYSFGRFFIEIIRSDSLYIGSIKVSILVSILLFISGSIILIRSKNKEVYRRNL